MTRLPPSASVAIPSGGAKLYAPSADRNIEPLCTLLKARAPKRGAALEIASGTGQHIVAFAAALPGLDWQPSDVAPDRLASIDAYVAEAGLNNVAQAIALDATREDWSHAVPPQDLIVLANLIHLIPLAAAKTLIMQAGQALSHGGLLMLYGPFKRGGLLTSQGDVRFDAELRAADPQIGYKNDAWMLEMLAQAGLRVILTQDMPANNLAFIAERISL